MNGEIFAVFIGASSTSVFGQIIPSIQTDRPDQTECPFIVPKNYVQVESGFLIEKGNDGFQTYNYPSALWKYGINDRL